MASSPRKRTHQDYNLGAHADLQSVKTCSLLSQLPLLLCNVNESSPVSRFRIKLMVSNVSQIFDRLLKTFSRLHGLVSLVLKCIYIQWDLWIKRKWRATEKFTVSTVWINHNTRELRATLRVRGHD